MKRLTSAITLGIVIFSLPSPLLALAQKREPSIPAWPPNVAFEVVDKGIVAGGHQEGEFVIRNESQWSDLWKDLHGPRSPRPAAPRIDFDKDMILAVMMGQQPTGGYSIEIEKITYGPKDLLVHVRQQAPRKDEPVTTMITSPYFIAKTERIDMPVRFEVEPLDQPGSAPSLTDQWKRALSGQEQAEVLAAITQMYKDLAGGDWKGLEDHFLPGATVSAARADERDRPGVRVYSVAEWISQSGARARDKDASEKKLLNQEVHTFGDLAQAWVQVGTRADSNDAKRGSARIDAVTLRKVDGRWKIAALAQGRTP